MESKHTFNEVTREYERYRPRYPKELFEEIAASNSVTPTSPILDIGCGTGQATGGLVESGFDRITCIELGEKLAAAVREKFRHSPNVQVVHAHSKSGRRAPRGTIWRCRPRPFTSNSLRSSVTGWCMICFTRVEASGGCGSTHELTEDEKAAGEAVQAAGYRITA
ncbi:rRNA adenine N-6-methyltransferase family protein [Paenibacillus mucilaginosus]|uniref:Methyltransferase domain-containing protein n=1 Tax=Paenibacillus mucilaginosus (strain KNP414) TaxID=1036673 RepID=F8F7W3_PAEMK|nr:rRNA adenine N-6-methyltransferase family protein [Paenibacillus mucilaginosus]AEI40867.1 hypothetical protein KNP414_02306 [Paenibacillus mucilaginosus KNP414]MCG7211668.1 methyltransferase domain-containing protein [Paenibacillus mucilaginosus]WDM29973.1 methyltransferase domain-containing protein [Paenibacillus mucilaginosus]